MEFPFLSHEEELALTAHDDDIYPYLGVESSSHYGTVSKWHRRICFRSIRTTSLVYEEQPNTRPLSLNDLRTFHYALGSLNGYWSIPWPGDQTRSSGFTYDDGFRRVMSFGLTGIELVVRLSMAHGPAIPRIVFPRGDAQDCVENAMHQVQNATTNPSPHGKVVGVLGCGSILNPRYDPNFLHRLDPDTAGVPFEWKIWYKPGHRTADSVQKWRQDICGGGRMYRDREEEFLEFLQHNGLDDPRKTTRRQLPPLPSLKVKTAERSVDEVDASEAIDPDPLPLPGAIMSPTPQGSRGSRGSFASDASHVASTMAGLSFQSPSLSSREIMPPPPEDSYRGGPQGGPRWTPGEFGGEHASQNPLPGYQGPGQAQQARGYGQLTDVYRHPSYDVQGPTPQAFREGIPNMRQHTPYGERIMPPPGQQSRSWWHVDEQAPAKPSSQAGPHAVFAQPHPGSGYAGQLGSNVPLPEPGSNTQRAGGHSRGFPPTQSVMHGGGDYLPGQPQNSIATLLGEWKNEYLPHDVASTESPEPLDLTQARSGQGNLPSNFPSHMQSVSQPQGIGPISSSAMRGFNPPQFQTPRTLAPDRGNYQLSSAPSLPSTAPEVIRQPEYEDISAHSGSNAGSDVDEDEEKHPVIYTDDISMFQPLQHPDDQEPGSEGEYEHFRYSDVEVSQPPQHPVVQERGPESESDLGGEDDRPTYRNARVSHPLQHAGGQNVPELCHSPQPIRGIQPGDHRDPMWGADNREENISEGNESEGNRSEGTNSEETHSEADNSEEFDSSED